MADQVPKGQVFK